MIRKRILTNLLDPNARDRAAVIENERQWTYGDFSKAVEGLARLLEQKKANRVAICLKQGFDVYAAEVAAYLCGVEFCPVSFDNPDKRKTNLISEFEPDLIVGASEDAQLFRSDRFISTHELPLPDSYETLIHLTKIHKELSREFAYTIFTSGSTGFPKGVRVKCRSLENLIEWAAPIYCVTPDDRWAQYSSIGFDLSIFDLMMAVSHGAALIPFSNLGEKMLPAAVIRTHNVTVWHSVPSAVDAMDKMSAINHENLNSVRLFSFCGEPLYKSHVKKIMEANESAKIFNTYGPTEACILCSHIELTAKIIEKLPLPTIPIGKEIAGFQFEVNESSENIGELVLVSEFIASKYINADSQDFYVEKVNVSGAEKEIVRYKTGDIVERVGGHLYFKHRSDSQVKIHGFRIDLTEVDAALRHVGCSAAKSVVLDGRLLSFYCANEKNEECVHRDIAEILPPYAIPSKLIKVDTMPYNSNGKIDSNALVARLRLKN